MKSLMMTVVAASVFSAQQVTIPPTEIARDVRKHLMSMPYYGP